MGIANFFDHIYGSYNLDLAAAGVSRHLPGSMTYAGNPQSTSTKSESMGIFQQLQQVVEWA